ncbi:MAG: TolC family protein, partial [Prevotella sp.]|nr:TolC family protein [Prevotella sp.]
MNIKNIIAVAIVGFALTSCGLYKKYDTAKTQELIPQNVFGTPVVDTLAMKADKPVDQMSWREFFTDPLLQKVIEQALANNTDLYTARINVEKSKIALRTARLAYLPSLNFTPQGTLSSFDNSKPIKTYNLQMQASVDLDVFGSITSKKRAAKAALMQSEFSELATFSNLISTVAQDYFYLQLLDREMEILTQTDSLWKASLDTQIALWQNGKAYSTAVNQQESSYLNVKTQIVDTQREILAVENELCEILAITPQHIERS